MNVERVDKIENYRHVFLACRFYRHIPLHVSIKGDFMNMKPVVWRAEAPYDALPPLPPAIDQVETRAVLKACICARAALGEV